MPPQQYVVLTHRAVPSWGGLERQSHAVPTAAAAATPPTRLSCVASPYSRHTFRNTAATIVVNNDMALRGATDLRRQRTSKLLFPSFPAWLHGLCRAERSECLCKSRYRSEDSPPALKERQSEGSPHKGAPWADAVSSARPTASSCDASETL